MEQALISLVCTKEIYIPFYYYKNTFLYTYKYNILIDGVSRCTSTNIRRYE